ncbi:MAG: antitoxin VbhA family protein [Micrococcales bacterium]|nr:antitoxin VbhA family protein [Micrococcales bacterium]
MKRSSKERQKHVTRAVANARLEGLSVSEDSRRLADNYVIGKASAKQTADKIRQRYGITVK